MSDGDRLHETRSACWSARQSGEPRRIAAASERYAIQLSEHDRDQEAADLFASTAEAYLELGDIPGEIRCRRGHATCVYYSGPNREGPALRSLERARALLRDHGEALDTTTRTIEAARLDAAEAMVRADEPDVAAGLALSASRVFERFGHEQEREDVRAFLKVMLGAPTSWVDRPGPP